MLILVHQCIIGKEIWLDPTEEEAKQATGTLVYAGMPALGTITNIWQTGRMTTQEVFEVCVAQLIPAVMLLTLIIPVYGSVPRKMYRYTHCSCASPCR